MLKVKPTGQRGRTTAGSGRNSNEVVTGVALEAFAGGCTKHHIL